jgi:glyoxylase-like metal-dependent hydrolase (beta-lactamase superfamily II)
MQIQPFYDSETATFSYIIIDKNTKKCAVIDSVIGFDIYSGKVSTLEADKIINYIKKNNLTLEWILETHIHADHLSAASYIKEKAGGKTGIGNNIKEVLNFWIPIFNTSADTPKDGSQFDRLFFDGEVFLVGKTQIKVINTPGHTPACVSYFINDDFNNYSAIFVGDAILMPDVGTARTDFPGASAEKLYDSIQKIFCLPQETQIFVGHDYPQKRKKPNFMTTISKQRKSNILVNKNMTKKEYVAARNKKDIGRAAPKLLFPSIQFNLRAGNFGSMEENKVKYIKIPVSS